MIYAGNRDQTPTFEMPALVLHHWVEPDAVQPVPAQGYFEGAPLTQGDAIVFDHGHGKLVMEVVKSGAEVREMFP